MDGSEIFSKPESESLEFDVVIVGAGPAGLSAAIRLGQLSRTQKKSLTIAVIEKSARIGGHILSGAVLETRALDELLPDWKNKNAPVNIAVGKDLFYLLTENKKILLPKFKNLRNKNDYLISLGQLCEWLAQEAELVGVHIFTGFAAAKILYKDNQVVGVRTQDCGINKNGKPSERFQPGIDLLAKQTLFAEGCRGYLSEQLISRYNLRANADPQTYALGLKELWEIPESQHEVGKVIHTVGWPLNNNAYGGSFIYHLDKNKIALGLVVGLDYKNPYLDPFEEFQRWKTHPYIKGMLSEGSCIGYGARALNEGGFTAIPKLSFPGGLLIGCSAGFVNVGKIKGIHNAMKSGMLAAETIFQNLDSLPADAEFDNFSAIVHASWIDKDLQPVRNIRYSFRYGLWLGLAYTAFDQIIFRGKLPWTFHNKIPDHQALLDAHQCDPIFYPKPDGKISFDRLTLLTYSGTQHNENQPSHLLLKDKKIPLEYNLKKFDGPEQRYCPAGVYEFVTVEGKKQFQINFANCLHCKTCDIKDPKQNITWTTPEGGDGPRYVNL